MHIFAGIAALAAVFYAASLFLEQAFHGYLNVAALVLIGGGPYAVALISFDFGALVDSIRILGRSLVHSGAADQTRMMKDLYRFGRAMREGRVAEAGRLLSGQVHPLLADLGGLALSRAEPAAITHTVATVAYARIQRIKRAEEVVLTLARVAPAMGMIGTVIGMIQLLSHLEQFDKLGSGMAVAMVSTLYGLIGQHAVYTPLARQIDLYGRRTTVTTKLLERGLVAIVTGRPLNDLRLLAGEAGETGETADLGEEAA